MTRTGPPGIPARGGQRISVAIDVYRLAYFWGRLFPVLGINRYVKEVFDRLMAAQQEFDVTPLCYPNRKNFDLYFLREKMETFMAEADVEVAPGFRPRAGSEWLGSRISRAIRRKVKSTRLQEALARFLNPVFFRTQRPRGGSNWAVYHSPYGPLPPKSFTGAAQRIVTIMDCIYYLRPELYPSPSTPEIRRIVRSVDPAADHIICPSEFTKSDLLSIYPSMASRIRVIPLGCHEGFFRPDEHDGRPMLERLGLCPSRYIAALARPNPRKNMARLVEAFGMLRQKEAFSGLQLVLVVSSKFHQQIREQVARETSDLSGVVFASNMSDEDLAYLYSRAALFAYVSLYEGFGLPPLEAMAAGCPVVASNATSVPEVVGDAGLYVDPLDTESIASAMEQMLSDGGLRRRMIEKGKAQASAFTWAHTFERTVAFYREVAQAART